MKNSLVLLLVPLLLTACAHTSGTADRLELARANAGAPVDSFQYSRNLRFTPLGDQALAVRAGAEQGYLLELRTRCDSLNVAQSIAITNAGGQVRAGQDSVRVLSRPPRNAPRHPLCRIDTIKPLDLDGIRAGNLEMYETQPEEAGAVQE
ncbi:hypothetical protein IP90_02427 [Luteimonas cucumeris]|uniref:Lipoprotein n=1 Tax=Luteimonas cucumeris TaxID=985012 RepID=A0A562L2J6_9GAMM|nr:DUF6491 family protein [Luteimonas cucumeris]TWI01867.1 hypothetical protein IP90_02427 [Luteimonas cucumeris]